jgi:glycosyltransferase involved in cell wall biosynthesis
LIAYLRRRNPRVVMAAMDVSNIMLVGAAALSGYEGRTVISQRAVVAASLRELAPARRVLTRLLQRVCFPRAHGVVSNSYAAALDLQTSLGVPADKVVTIHNALDTERIVQLACEALPDQFRRHGSVPLIVSVGSLTKRKDMETLVRAFARVSVERDVRLAIVGKGEEGPRLKALVSALGLSAKVDLPGFDANPYKWIAAATVFVSSSTAEGFPNVVAEALALDRPVVATDCPGDTAELLQQGRWGRLVPVGDPDQMALAIMAALDDQHRSDGRVRAAEFSPDKIAAAYLAVLLPGFPEAAAGVS